MKKGRNSTVAETKKNLLTRAGLNKLEKELQDLKVNRRQEIAEKIKEAREQGDLSENAEYDAAKDEQREIEERIVAIETLLKNAEVVDDAEEGCINIGCKVKLYDKEFDEEVEYHIVGSTEANSLQGKISNESPVGMALLHHRVGDTVKVETQAGDMEYKVLSVERSGEE
jgi:transcription elongation factor greA